MRKLSQKAVITQDRSRRQGMHAENQYYLPHPQGKVLRLNKDGEPEEKERIVIKCRKQSYNPAQTSIPINKIDPNNHSKQLDPASTGTKKVQRKVRSTSSGQTPKKPLSKSAFKLQLTSRKRECAAKRVTLQLDTPTTKKPTQKIGLQQMNYDSYYSTRPVMAQSKSIRTLKKPQSQQRPTSHSAAQLQSLLVRCKLVIQQYSQQLQSFRRENQYLQQQNRRLRQCNGW